ncbi:hypothetical protein ACQKP8_15505 [Photobacterium alginatilyticum]|uniref:hypothetical protein n=1 Tax=Photobacterium alginatilyticum TaxID=1775171 RepID=UPI004068E9F4
MKERLTLLRQTDLITQQAYTGTLNAAQFLSGHLNIDPCNEQFQIAMEHLAMAVDRITAGDPISKGLDPILLGKVYQDDAYEQLSALNLATLTFFDITAVPETENSYLINNIFTLFYINLPEEEAC